MSTSQILNRDGRASGIGYVELASEDDLEPAKNMNEKNIANYSRYARVLECAEEELKWYLDRWDVDNEVKKFRVSMNGLPFRASEYEIAKVPRKVPGNRRA